MRGDLEGSANYNSVCEERDSFARQLKESREYAQHLRIEIERLKLDLQDVTRSRNSAEIERDDANKIAADAKFQNERLVEELGKAQREYLLRAQGYGQTITELKNELRYTAAQRHNYDPTHITERWSKCDREDCQRVWRILG